ncbi:MAG: endonuclease/exonuclease/phosphatase family protein [Verrucomicrobia bacterium]|nr:endonuclease/exonuclease/phosphatase family protein [Verrucomicrobiota bacterium]
MHLRNGRSSLVLAAVLCLVPAIAIGAGTFTVATYNVENYIDAPSGTRPAKSPASKAKIRESIRAMRPHVLALQEIGNTNALLELRSALKADGLDYPHWEHASGFDTNIYVAVLSQFPIVARRPHTNEGFLLSGRRFRVSRGFAEIDIQVNAQYRFTLFAAHLKSRRAVAVADEAEMREQEALILREKIDARLKANPEVNLIVLGDLNDVKDSRSTRIIIGRGRAALTDTRPAERNGDDQPNPNPQFEPRHITWTHHYGKEDTYSRIDYILLSRGMAREWNTNGTYILTQPNWGVGSDHRPIVASFVAAER